ncbi:MAG: hypothetical protein ABIJ45_01115 [Candidatus Zixiibacteriota bacterium]
MKNKKLVMIGRFGTVLFLIIGFFWISIVANDSENELNQIIQRYSDVCGGSKLNDIGTVHRIGTMVRGGTGRTPVNTYGTQSGCWRYDQTFAWGDRISYLFDRTSGWIVGTDTIIEMSNSQRRELALMLDPLAPLKLRELFTELTLLEDDQLGDRKVHNILATAFDGTAIELAFDIETGLLVRAGQLFFEDYRPVGSTTQAFRILLGQDGEGFHRRMTLQYSAINTNVEADDSLFSQPTCRLPRAEPVLYTSRVEKKISREELDACTGLYKITTDTTGIIWQFEREEDHLMFCKVGQGIWREIIPESETDYFIRFPDAEIHFVKDSTGQVVALEFGKKRSVRAEKIK